MIKYKHDAMLVPHLVVATLLSIFGQLMSGVKLLHSKEHQGNGILIAQLLVNGVSDTLTEHSSILIRTIRTRQT